MPVYFDPYARPTWYPRAADASHPPLYPCDLLSEMQRTLAALADIETCREIEQERTDQSAEPQEQSAA